MPRYVEIKPHLTLEEVQEHYQDAQTVTEHLQWQIVWLLARGKRSPDVADFTGCSEGWIREVARRYNQLGPKSIGDLRKNNQGRSRLLNADQEAELKVLLEQAQTEGIKWTGPQVAKWMSQRLERPIHATRGWEVLRRLTTADTTAHSDSIEAESHPKPEPTE
jgi:transposase